MRSKGISQPGFISPTVSHLAAELGVDLAQVVGTGAGGRITKKDVLAYVAAPVPRGDAASVAADREFAELSRWEDLVVSSVERSGAGGLFEPAQELVASAMSQQIPPFVTAVVAVDMTQVLWAREKLKGEFERQGVVLPLTPFFLQAIVAGLKAVPEANRFAENGLLVQERIHIGLAAAISDDPIPVIRDADEKSLLDLARAVNDLAERASEGKLASIEVQGGTFALANHGATGSLFATPIVNEPQAGILSVGAIEKRAVVLSQGNSLLPNADDTIVIRPMAYLSFAFDHRILNSQAADRFLMAVKRFLEGYAS